MSCDNHGSVPPDPEKGDRYASQTGCLKDTIASTRMYLRVHSRTPEISEPALYICKKDTSRCHKFHDELSAKNVKIITVPKCSQTCAFCMKEDRYD